MVAITLLVIILQNKMYMNMKVKLYMHYDVLKVYSIQLIVLSKCSRYFRGVYCFSFYNIFANTFIDIYALKHSQFTLLDLTFQTFEEAEVPWSPTWMSLHCM